MVYTLILLRLIIYNFHIILYFVPDIQTQPKRHEILKLTRLTYTKWLTIYHDHVKKTWKFEINIHPTLPMGTKTRKNINFREKKHKTHKRTNFGLRKDEILRKEDLREFDKSTESSESGSFFLWDQCCTRFGFHGHHWKL